MAGEGVHGDRGPLQPDPVRDGESRDSGNRLPPGAQYGVHRPRHEQGRNRGAVPCRTQGNGRGIERRLCANPILGRVSVVLEKEFEKPEINQRYIVGVDIGSSTLACVSIFDIKTSKIIKQLYFGRDVAIRQRRYSERRDKLKSLTDKGSHRARQHLNILRRKQSDFVKTRSGQISKEIVNLAIKYNAYISIEKLKNLRGRRGKFNKKANRKINRIPYGKFIEFLKSNCEMFQIPLYEVDAYHTSKWCPKCGALNNGHYSGNYALYKCGCGLVVNSDRKASLAVAVKSVLERTKTHELTILSSIQISKTRVPVNGLLRSDDIVNEVAVQHNYQPMESHS